MSSLAPEWEMLLGRLSSPKEQFLLATHVGILLYPLGGPGVKQAHAQIPLLCYLAATGTAVIPPGSVGPMTKVSTGVLEVLEQFQAAARASRDEMALSEEGFNAVQAGLATAVKVCEEKGLTEQLREIGSRIAERVAPPSIDLFQRAWSVGGMTITPPAWWFGFLESVVNNQTRTAEEWADLTDGLVEAPPNVAESNNIGPMSVPMREPSPLRPSLKMLDDAPCFEDDPNDTLGFKVYADTLADLIQHPETQLPFTLAINGPWGSGKSTLAHMIQRRLERIDPKTGQPRNIVIWFNAWMNDEAKSLAGSFTASVAKEAGKRRRIWNQIRKPLPRALWDSRTQKIYANSLVLVPILVISLVALYARYGLVPQEVRDLFASLLGQQGAESLFKTSGGFAAASAALSGILAGTRKLSEIGNSLADYAKDPTKAAESGSIGAARSQLRDLLQDAVRDGQRFVIIVDDIERVQPPRAIEVLDTINQLLADAPVAVVLLGDMSSVAACAGIKYAGLADSYDPAGARPEGGSQNKLHYGRLYLQKIVQMQFDLPPHRPERVRAWIEKIAIDEKPSGEVPSAPKPAPLKLKKRSGLRKLWDIISGPDGDYNIILGLLLFGGLAVPLYKDYPAGSWILIVICLLAVFGWFLKMADRRKRIYQSEVQQKQIEDLAVQFRDQQIPSHVLAEQETASIGDAQGVSFAEKKARVEEALRLARMSDSNNLREAVGTALDLSGVLPRSAKRLINGLRVVICLAEERQLMNDNLGPKMIGKWLALRERWPDLVQMSYHDKGLLKRIEDGEDVELKALEGETVRIREFLLRDGLQIGQHVSVLVHLDPEPQPS